MRCKPYTERGIRRLPCYRCGAKPSQQQWQICADGNVYRPACVDCDVALNALVLQFMKVPYALQKIAAYQKALLGCKGRGLDAAS